MRYLFRRCQRLLKPADFQNVFAQPFKSADRYLTVLARPNDLAYPRLGLAIAKRQARLSVDRNRLKRLTRESFRLNQHDLDNLDCVVMARQAAVQANNAMLLYSLSKHWKRVVQQCRNA